MGCCSDCGHDRHSKTHSVLEWQVLTAQVGAENGAFWRTAGIAAGLRAGAGEQPDDPVLVSYVDSVAQATSMVGSVPTGARRVVVEHAGPGIERDVERQLGEVPPKTQGGVRESCSESCERGFGVAWSPNPDEEKPPKEGEVDPEAEGESRELPEGHLEGLRDWGRDSSPVDPFDFPNYDTWPHEYEWTTPKKSKHCLRALGMTASFEQPGPEQLARCKSGAFALVVEFFWAVSRASGEMEGRVEWWEWTAKWAGGVIKDEDGRPYANPGGWAEMMNRVFPDLSPQEGARQVTNPRGRDPAKEELDANPGLGDDYELEPTSHTDEGCLGSGAYWLTIWIRQHSGCVDGRSYELKVLVKGPGTKGKLAEVYLPKLDKDGNPTGTDTGPETGGPSTFGSRWADAPARPPPAYHETENGRFGERTSPFQDPVPR